MKPARQRRFRHVGSSWSAGLAVLMLLGGCVASPGTPSGPPTGRAEAGKMAAADSAPEEAMSPAASALAAGEAETAYRGYSLILKRYPGDRRAQLGLAESALALGDGERAYHLFRRIEPSSPVAAAVWQGQGIALMRLGRAAEASAPLQRAVDADPSLWRAWNALGQLHDARRQWEAARECYQRALTAHPSAATVHNNLGVSLLLQGRSVEAARAFAAALHFDRHLKPAQGNLRLALAAQGRYDDALAGADPASRAVALNNVGYVALTRGDVTTAESLLMAAVEKSPNFYEKASRNLEQARALRAAEPAR